MKCMSVVGEGEKMIKKFLIYLMLTLNMIFGTCFAADLHIGSKGAMVEYMQIQLFEAGYFFGAIDGDFGRMTQRALRLFQYHNNIPVDGIFGDRTKRVLERQIQSTSNDLRIRVVEEAFTYLGVRYQWGGNSRNGGVDCSGLVKNIFNKIGYEHISRTADEQYKNGTPISKTQLLPGDLVFFDTSDSNEITHVGIFVGGGDCFIHAGVSTGVTVANLSNLYWNMRYKCACRILNC